MGDFNDIPGMEPEDTFKSKESCKETVKLGMLAGISVGVASGWFPSSGGWEGMSCGLLSPGCWETPGSPSGEDVEEVGLGSISRMPSRPASATISTSKL